MFSISCLCIFNKYKYTYYFQYPLRDGVELSFADISAWPDDDSFGMTDKESPISEYESIAERLDWIGRDKSAGTNLRSSIFVAMAMARSRTSGLTVFSDNAARLLHSAIPTDTNTANPRIPHVVID